MDFAYHERRARDQIVHAATKVPEVTLIFWIIKIAVRRRRQSSCGIVDCDRESNSRRPAFHNRLIMLRLS
jgi:hypothetical protein